MIVDQKQSDLPWPSEEVSCRRCKGVGKTAFWQKAAHGGRRIEVVGGHEITCPDCEGKGKLTAPLFSN